jgi:hypothetical protein
MSPAPGPEPGFPIRPVRGLGMGLEGAPKVGAGIYRARGAPPPGKGRCETVIAIPRADGGRKSRV